FDGTLINPKGSLRGVVWPAPALWCYQAIESFVGHRRAEYVAGQAASTQYSADANARAVTEGTRSSDCSHRNHRSNPLDSI
ncbi:MAG: hypothetical protein LAO18_23650, partial [Acidobacteriia bacterium]|nr:hypothetical protein [Terriglobia bacterium]